MIGGVGSAASLQGVGRSANVSDVAQQRQPRACLLDLRQLLCVLDEHADRLGVADHVGAVARGAVGVDRGADRADQAQREVEQAPLQAGRGRRSRTRLPSERRARASRFAMSSTRRAASPERDRNPAALAFRQVGDVGRIAGARVSPEAGDRAGRARGRSVSCAIAASLSTLQCRRRPPAAPWLYWVILRRDTRVRLESRCPMRTTWNGSISFSLVTIPVGLAPATKPSARAVGRRVPAAAPRVPLADQEPPLVPGARARGRKRRDRQGLGGREGPVRDRRGRRPGGDRAPEHLTLDRDRALRPARTRSTRSTSTARTSSCPRARRRAGVPYVLLLNVLEGRAGRRDRPLRPVRQGEALPDSAEGRRARPRDAVRRRGRLFAGGDRRGDGRDGRQEGRARPRPPARREPGRSVRAE